MIVVAVTNFSGTTTPDKNGEAAVMLQCIAGTMPNRNVLSGTVARRAGFEVGNTYLANVRETGYDDVFGPDYTFVKIHELKTGLDIVQASKELGEARILYVQRPEGFEQHYQRKGDAIESNRAKRIREGLYHPTVATTIANHETAREIRSGSSVGSGGTIINQDEMIYDDEGEPLFPEPEENEESEDVENDQDEDQDQQNQQSQQNRPQQSTTKNTGRNTGSGKKGNK